MVAIRLVKLLNVFLDQVTIAPRRLSLTTPYTRATVPMLRGVWGAALRGLDMRAYEAVFSSPESDGAAPPLYILRPAPPDPHDAPAVEWILTGAALEHDAALMEAWRIAAGMGLGKKRVPFTLRAIRPIGPDGALLAESEKAMEWRLSSAAWPVDGDPLAAPCRLEFPAPLRILRRKVLVESPSLKDIVVASARRVEQFLPAAMGAAFHELTPLLLEAAEKTHSGKWQGDRLDLVRYSARQEKELRLEGVSGSLVLPRGPGELWPLLAAAQWIHAGKGSIVGLGQLSIRACEEAGGV